MCSYPKGSPCALWTVFEIARRLGIDQALGPEFAGQLALWQVLARVIEQGSRWSAVRWAQRHAACDVIGIRRGFDENDLYANLTWLSQHQESIEKRLFAKRSGQKPNLFLYDVTSSYLEGKCHAYGAYGYNRDGKKTRSRWSSACCATSRARRSRRRFFAATRKIRKHSPRR